MPEIKRMASQFVKGLPYLKKEIEREISMRTGYVLSAPTTYYVIFSGRCNLACTFCEIYKMPEPSLTGEEVFRVIREAKELSNRGFNISLSGGEPTIFKPLYDCLQLAHESGVNFGFTTNGLAFTKENVRRMLSFDPFNINVSLESVDPAINEALRPFKNGTHRTLEGIENLLEEKERVGSRVSIIVKPTIMEQNYRKLPDLVRYFGRHSKVQVNFQPYVGHVGDRHWVADFPSLRSVLDEILALQADGYSVVGNAHVFDGFYEYLQNPPIQGHLRHLDLNGEKRNCDIGLRTMSIFPNGDVFFCDFLGKPIGNIHQNSLSEIFHGEMARRQRKQMIYCDIDCQQTCKRKTPLLVKARSFMRMG